MTGTLLAAHLARVLDDAAIFACRDSALPMINAVRLESSAKHLIAVATDRFMLGSAVADYDEEQGGGAEFAVSLGLPHAQLVAKVAKSTKALFTNVAISQTDETMDFAFASGENLSVPKLADTMQFPDWRKFAEAASDPEGSTKSIGMNPQYLARFGRVHDSRRMVIKLNGPSKPSLVSVGSQFVGVIMPIRLDEAELDSSLPAWMARQEPKKPARRKATKKESVA